MTQSTIWEDRKLADIWEDRKLAEVLRHPQMMSVLWAIQHERYTSVEDFERHLHEDLHAEELISALGTV